MSIDDEDHLTPGGSSSERDERLVEFIRHFRGRESQTIETGTLLVELARAVLDGNPVRAQALAEEAIRFVDGLDPVADDEDEALQWADSRSAPRSQE